MHTICVIAVHYSNIHTVEELPRWPQLYLEIGSFDFWGQHRIEGYCCLSLPTRPGWYCLPLEHKLDIAPHIIIGLFFDDKMNNWCAWLIK